MLVGVTGGTGFVGAHSIAEIVRAGHRVRVLTRDASRVRRALAPLGVPVDASAVDVVTGDVTDEAAVRRAVDGVAAVVHAASVYSFDSRSHAAMRRTNARGTRLVLDAAHRAGADPIVHVSTVAALFPSPTAPLGPDSPVGRPREAYMASKAEAERVARDLQARGAPVVISYPPALLGPHDPNLGDQSGRLRNLLRGLLPIWPRGGFPLGDVRDTARLHAALLTSPRDGTDRYFGPAHHVTTGQYVAAARRVTGRALPALRLPARPMLPLGRLVDLCQHVWPWHIPAEYGAIYTCVCDTRVAEDADRLGIDPRPVAETMRDTVAWMRRQGLLTERQAGLAGSGFRRNRVADGAGT